MESPLQAPIHCWLPSLTLATKSLKWGGIFWKAVTPLSTVLSQVPIFREHELVLLHSYWGCPSHSAQTGLLMAEESRAGFCPFYTAFRWFTNAFPKPFLLEEILLSDETTPEASHWQHALTKTWARKKSQPLLLEGKRAVVKGKKVRDEILAL